MNLCKYPLDDGRTCQRPAGHTSWSIEAGWRPMRIWATSQRAMDLDLDVSPYAHASWSPVYDREVAAWLTPPE